MNIRKNLLLGALIGGAMITFDAPAVAVPIVYNLTADSVGTRCANVGADPCGTVTLTDLGGDTVEVRLDLFEDGLAGRDGDIGLVDTGSHEAISFNIDDIIDAETVNIAAPLGYTVNSSPGMNSPYGPFNFALDCSICGTGATNPQYGDVSVSGTSALVFTVMAAGLTPASFVQAIDGAYFAVDVTVDGLTGVIADSGVMEPSTVLLFTAGLLGLALFRRRKIAA